MLRTANELVRQGRAGWSQAQECAGLCLKYITTLDPHDKRTFDAAIVDYMESLRAQNIIEAGL